MALADAWELDEPIAVSGDVHQARWRIAVRGRASSDTKGRHIEAKDIVVGCWTVTPLIDGRPRGDLPDVSAGASPAYNLREHGGVVRSIIVERVSPDGHLTVAGDPAVARLLDAVRAWNPYARPGWAPAADCPFVVITSREAPVAGAALIVDRTTSVALASSVAIHPAAVAPDCTAADLIDVLEAVAFDNGASVIRLDGTAFLFDEKLHLAQRGYTVEPPYDGDADVEIWAEHSLHD